MTGGDADQAVRGVAAGGREGAHRAPVAVADEDRRTRPHQRPALCGQPVGLGGRGRRGEPHAVDALVHGPGRRPEDLRHRVVGDLMRLHRILEGRVVQRVAVLDDAGFVTPRLAGIDGFGRCRRRFPRPDHRDERRRDQRHRGPLAPEKAHLPCHAPSDCVSVHKMPCVLAFSTCPGDLTRRPEPGANVTEVAHVICNMVVEKQRGAAIPNDETPAAPRATGFRSPSPGRHLTPASRRTRCGR